MATATTADVEARFSRALDDDELRLAGTLLQNVELMIRKRAGDLSTLDQEALVLVESMAVARVLRNPEGVTEQNAEGFGYKRDPAVAGGRLAILSEWWHLLGINQRYAAIPMKFRTR